jgi:hypothetical protein
MRKNVTLDIATPGQEPHEVELSVRPATMADRRRVAAHVSAFAARGGGDALAELANVAFAVAGVPDEQLEALSPYDQLILGRRLAEWIVEGDQKNG